jgi:circadian clock protein KaiB
VKKRTSDGAPLLLRLYVAGESPNSVLAKTNLRIALGLVAKNDATLEIIDVLRDPDRALRDGVLITPTLIRLSPLPEQRAIGNLKDSNALLMVLGRSAPDGD